MKINLLILDSRQKNKNKMKNSTHIFFSGLRQLQCSNTYNADNMYFLYMEFSSKDEM